MGKQGAIAALREQRRATLALLSRLDDAAWERPCLPGWGVTDVVTHLIAIDSAATTGRLLPLLRAARGREDIEQWNERAVRRAEDATPAALLAELERVGSRLTGVASRVPRLLWRLPLRTVFGRHPIHFLLARRVLDEWVHTVDIARACELAEPMAVPCPDVVATAVLDALPSMALPTLDIPAGVVRLVVATGEVGTDDVQGPRRTWGVDFARRHYGPRVATPPDATMRLHAAALALLVEGRDVGAYGPVEVDGNEALAERMLRTLAVR